MATILEQLGYKNVAGGSLRNSFLRQFTNANNAYRNLQTGDGLSQEEYDGYKSMLNAERGQALYGGLASLIGGASGIIGANQNIRQLGDNREFDYQLNELRNLGSTDFASYDDIANAYNRMRVPVADYDTIRGGSDLERAGNLAASTLSGAASGASVGGIWGGVAGGLVGLGTGIKSWIKGNHEAEDKQRQDELDAFIAQRNATNNLGYQSDKLAEDIHRSKVASMKAYGGEMKRTTVQEFADKVLNRQRQNDRTHSANIIRQHCKGGTMIRIKTK